VSAVATYSDADHPLTTQPEQIRKTAVVIFTSDRGLAGAFSTNVLKEAEQLRTLLQDEGKEIDYYLVGRKAVNYFKFRKREFKKEWIGSTDLPKFETAQELAATLTEAFLTDYDEGGVEEIILVGNHFVSMISQDPRTTRLLPLEVVEAEDESEAELYPLYEFEPEVEQVLDALLPVYIENRIFNVMLQSAASEHAARQKAMKAATDNADKLIQDFTRLANQARQAEITQQISEIVGGADALGNTDQDN
jgi:F-type H+-transporting ATPase subunit gamma